MRINVVMITDNNYVLPTMVAIRSMLKNRKITTCFNVFVLGVNLSKDNLLNLEDMNKFSGINIKILDASQQINQYEKIDQNRHVTPAAMLKFFLPKIFENYNKILYLDSDIIVQKDLTNLYNIDIKSQYAAVCKDTLCAVNREYMDSIGIKNQFYFNSGVMLLNLKKMREDCITEKMLQFRLNVKQHFMDQDTFNAVIGYNVKYFSYKYNFLNYYMTVMNKNQLSAFFDANLNKSFKKICKGLNILHIGGQEKPWNKYMGYISCVWSKYYNLLCNSRSGLKFFYKTTFTNGRVHVYFKGIKIASYKKKSVKG